MRVIVATPPDPLALLPEFKEHLGFEFDEDEGQIAGYLAAAIGHIDGPGKWLGRCIRQQTLEARMDSFTCASIRLPYPEIIGVVSVKYVDGAGVEQTIAADSYEVLGRDVVPAYGAAWPVPRLQREAVRIRYQAGYTEVPDDLRAAVFLMAADLYNSRESFVAGPSITAVPMSTTVANLLSAYWVPR